MGWRIIYIEEANIVREYLNNIKIERDNGELLIPLGDIHTLIIDNYKLIITSSLITKCSEYNVNLVICGKNHMPISNILAINGNYRGADLLKKQICWTEKDKDLVHDLIIRNKIRNQYKLLSYLNKDRNVIDKMKIFSEEVNDGDKYNMEGLSAKIYFRELFGKKFIRMSEDIVNAGLNYGYIVLRTQISKTIIAKGLNPSIGIIHKGITNFFNLSDDIIEVFRPIIDEYVYENLTEEILFKKEYKVGLIKQTTKDAYINGSLQTIFNVISIFIDNIINIFDTKDITLYEDVVLKYGI